MDFEIRKDRSRKTGLRPVREREEYFRLMGQGVSSREACQIVGVDRRTGKRWRNGFHFPIPEEPSKTTAPPCPRRQPSTNVSSAAKSSVRSTKTLGIMRIPHSDNQ
jgi:hypothetical protein